MDKATPRPWHSIGREICKENIGPVACTYGINEEEEEANAQLIVKAINAYDEVQETMRILQSKASDRLLENIKLSNLNNELVEAVKDSIQLISSEYCSHYGECSSTNDKCYNQKNLQALAKAEGQK